MSARTPRWQLERAGIINLFDYANEEFVFDDGRLILKGPNGSGKSKAIEVLFPFLFDGDMAPTKLDPFGKRSRTMKWNLLMQKHEFRVGYVWATVVHDDPQHDPQRVSFGACLEAHKDWPDVRSRFFVIEDKRPRIDFDLVGTDSRPLRKDKLSELIRGLGGDDFTEARFYRERLNELLFGFQTQERMQQWIRLLRVLRKPQLSDNLNEDELNSLLSAALPEIEAEYLENASRRLDQIDESRRTHETRRRRIEALSAEVTLLNEQVANCETAIEAIAAQAMQAEREFSSLPQEAQTRKVFSDLEQVQRHEEAARVALDVATRRSANADREADLASGDLQLHCGRNDLPADTDPGKLDEYEQQLAGYVGSANELRLAEKERGAALALVEERSEDATSARQRAAAAAEAASERQEQLSLAQGRLEALAVVSEGAEAALARLAEIDTELAQLHTQELQLRSEKDAAIRQTGSLRTKVDGGREKVTATSQELADALATIRAFAGADLLPLALERASEIPNPEEARTWDGRKWCDFVGSLAPNVLQSRASREHLLNQLDQSYEILGQEIDTTQLQLARERVGGLVIVKPRMNGEEHSFSSLVTELSAQVVESEERLSEQDRQLFEDFVTGGLVEHLRVRIAEAHHSVQRMKDEIGRVEASSGMSIGLNWKRRDDDSPVLKRALELLQHSPAKLSDDDREALSSFIRSQIAEARLNPAENDTTAKQLERALDYRGWHRFVITKSNRRRGISEHEMTRHAHEAGSGGEKAIALHLPLLAAAASYPTSARPDALRLVILDEAFTRIDDEGRRGLMAMMVAFDLDIVLTSPDFWGCYREVPGLSIYQLAPHDPDHPGVVARHFVWNGHVRSEIEDDDLSQAA